jgi:hypothetical protein
MRSDPCHFAFFHITETDPVGHEHGWGSEMWLQVLRRIDRWLATLYDALRAEESLRGRWALILTADHGGSGNRHGDALDPRNHTVPFYVIAPALRGNTDLYGLVTATRADPRRSRPSYAAAKGPIRNGDAGNLALELLGLPQIAGSLMRGMQLAGN